MRALFYLASPLGHYLLLALRLIRFWLSCASQPWVHHERLCCAAGAREKRRENTGHRHPRGGGGGQDHLFTQECLKSTNLNGFSKKKKKKNPCSIKM